MDRRVQSLSPLYASGPLPNFEEKSFEEQVHSTAHGLEVVEVDDSSAEDMNSVDLHCGSDRNRDHNAVKTACEHVYEHDCIAQSPYKHDTCPMCRHKLV